MSSQLDFIQNKSVWDIMDEMLSQTTDIVDKREGSVLYDAILAMAVELEDFYNVRIPQMYDAFQVIKATGDDLDAWALDFGLSRIGAEQTFYTITIEPQNEEMVIGEVLRSHDTNELWVYQGSNIVASADPGNYSEAKYAVLEPSGSYPNITRVSINALQSEGRSVESDVQLRARIIAELSTRVGGSVMDYAYVVLNQFKGEQNARIPSVLIFSLGQNSGYVRVYPANAAFADIGEQHDLATMTRWCTQQQCDELKAYLDPIDAEGFGYGLAPIGHRVNVLQGGYYDLRFKVYVVFKSSDGLTPIGQEGLVTIYRVDTDITNAVETATLDYINEVDDRGLFTRENSTPQRRGGRYRMIYLSSEHVAALEAIKANWSNILGFQISYKKPGDEEWIEASDDYIQVINSYNDCNMFRVSELTVVGEVRAADWQEVNW